MTKNMFTGDTTTIETSLTDILAKHGFINGRMISLSKSRYGESHPNHKVYFNACIFDKKAKEVWYGDIDITEDEDKLKQIAKESKQTFYVTPEHPFRMDFNKVTKKQLENDEYVVKFNGDKK